MSFAEMSFAEFMNNQRHTTFTHEKAMDVTFYPMFQPYFRAMKTLRGYGGKYKGDISPAWAFWAAHVLKNHPKATKIVWIHRDIDEVAESFIKQKEKMLDAYKANFSGSDGFMGAYPVWEKEYSRDAIRRSVAKVFWLCKGMNTLYPDYVYPIHISSLNDENKQYELLSWLGYKDRDMRLGMPHLNRWEEVQVGNVYEGVMCMRGD
jgi:hypothetical protein